MSLLEMPRIRVVETNLFFLLLVPFPCCLHHVHDDAACCANMASTGKGGQQEKVWFGFDKLAGDETARGTASDTSNCAAIQLFVHTARIAANKMYC